MRHNLLLQYYKPHDYDNINEVLLDELGQDDNCVDPLKIHNLIMVNNNITPCIGPTAPGDMDAETVIFRRPGRPKGLIHCTCISSALEIKME